MCVASFENKTDVLSYKYCKQQHQKTLQQLAEHLEDYLECGTKGLPIILQGESNLSSLEAIGLDEHTLGRDALHNCKGHLDNIITLFSEEPGWNKSLALELLERYVGRKSFTQYMRGADFRLLFVHYKKAILPAVSHEPEEAKMILDLWIEIQYFVYRDYSKHPKTPEDIKRFRIVTFLHGLLCIHRWKEESMSLYLHDIWIHWADEFERHDFTDSSTEAFERYFARVKHILKCFTNRQKEYPTLRELVSRLSFETYGDIRKIKNQTIWNKIEKAFETHQFPVSYALSHKYFESHHECIIEFLNEMKSKGIMCISVPARKDVFIVFSF